MPLLLIVAATFYLPFRGPHDGTIPFGRWSHLWEGAAYRWSVWITACILAPLLLIATLGGWRFVRRRTGFGIGTSIAPARVYLEGFALYLVLITAGSDVVRHLLSPAFRVLTSGAMGAPLLAFGWVCVRGAGFRIVRRDLGFRRGRGVLREAAIGAMACVLIFALANSFLVFLGAIPNLVAEVARTPERPDLSGLWGAFAIELIWSAGLVPVVEETLFRGFLHRGLRGWLGWVSCATGSGIVFALLHTTSAVWPMHFVGGFGYTFLRDWRGSLVAPIAAHATHNAIALSVKYYLLSEFVSR